MIGNNLCDTKNKVWSFSFTGFIFIALVLSTAVSIIIPAIPNIMREKGLTSTLISMAFVSLLVGRFLASVFTGILLLRFNTYHLLFASFLLHILTMTLLVFSKGGYAFVSLRFAEGLFEGVVTVILQVMVIGLSKPEDRGVKMGYMGSALGLGFIIGPLIGGISMSLLGSSGVFIATNILITISTIWLIFIYKEIQDKLSVVYHHRVSFSFDFIKYIIFYSGPILQRGLFVSFAVLLPLYLVDKFHMKPYLVGTYFTASAIITTVLQSITGQLGQSPCRNYIVFSSMVIMGLTIALFGIVENQLLFTIIFIIETLAFAVMAPNAMKIFGDSVSSHPRSQEIIGTSSSLRELLNIVLVFCLVPLYEVNIMLPWIAISIMCFALSLPYLRLDKLSRRVSGSSPGSQFKLSPD